MYIYHIYINTNRTQSNISVKQWNKTQSNINVLCYEQRNITPNVVGLFVAWVRCDHKPNGRFARKRTKRWTVYLEALEDWKGREWRVLCVKVCVEPHSLCRPVCAGVTHFCPSILSKRTAKKSSSVSATQQRRHSPVCTEDDGCYSRSLNSINCPRTQSLMS